MGLEPILETQYRVNKQAWLDMTIPGDKTKTVGIVTEMAEEYPGANLTQRKCE